MTRIVFTLPREGESTIAVVTVEAQIQITTTDDAFKAIRRAVTKWVCDTDEGKELWQESCKDMNIGDLASHGITDGLRECLKEVGIEMLDIEVPDYCGLYTCHFTFDSHLVDEQELPEEVGEDA